MTDAGVDIPGLLRQIPTQYPFVLVDRILEHDPAGRIVALKNGTGSEEFFEGHFPGQPVMPGVLLMEALAQAAGIWLLRDAPDPRRLEVHVVGIDEAKFRRPAVPGDQLRLEVEVLHRRGALCRFRGEVRSGEHRVAEARLLLQVAELEPTQVDPLARVDPRAELAPGVRIGPYCLVGPRVRIGARTVLESHVVVDGDTTIGADNRVFPFASIGLVPQDLKFHGEESRVVIGDHNSIRECVTIHRGTEGGGSLTRIGSHNLLMAQVHVAHDCQVGSHTIFANGATLAGHVEVADYATIGAYSGVHQFCRVGAHAFVGGYTVATKDVLPFSKTVGNRARLYGPNVLGLVRRGFSADAISAIRQAYRVLLQSHLNVSDAVARLEAAPQTPEVAEIVRFIRTAKRGVVCKRAHRRAAAGEDD
ncbi:MAG TPA: acyl-ACP--UDP-N-acetylglucosamine O-acyltransferase [Vicinamibacteria bacterium]|nr:acyl-ACP--UDP-N-acetylglucosamine O-acyltransferase [Vicinamibacteria bacterium]